jgi:hypothetical protein
MTANVTDTVVIPVPRPASEATRPPRRQRPLSEYWDVREARWVAAPR